MSQTRLDFDNCTYRQVLAESVGPGDYLVNTPTVECLQCESSNPYVRPSRTYGPSYDANCSGKGGWVDVQSELLGITRSYSKCPTDKYLPGGKYDIRVPNGVYTEGKECRFLETEDTKISNPPCTLRGMGINRFEFLHEDPQCRAMEPFPRMGTQMKWVARDNHKPCLPTPLEVTNIVDPNAPATCGADAMLEKAYTEPKDVVLPDIPMNLAWKDCRQMEPHVDMCPA